MSILHLLTLWSQRRKNQQGAARAQEPEPPRTETERPPKDEPPADED